MRINGWAGSAVVAGGVAACVGPNFDEAQATADRQTTDCLTSHLSHEERAGIARYADKNDFASL